EIADEVSPIHLAERIELDEPAGIRRRSRVVTGRILFAHHALERLDHPPAQRLTAKEGPFIELLAIAEREALEKVGEIMAAGLLELAAVAGLLEQLRIHPQVDCSRPLDRRPVDRENVLAER